MVSLTLNQLAPCSRAVASVSARQSLRLPVDDAAPLPADGASSDRPGDHAPGPTVFWPETRPILLARDPRPTLQSRGVGSVDS
jgi:hypothetical protein